jgi:hypothetical protein
MDGSALISDRSDVEALRRVSAALAIARARASGDPRTALRQDGLDLLATVAGLKPVCLLGRGAREDQWIDTALALAARSGLYAMAAAPWDAEDSAAMLPEWYVHAAARRRAAHPVLYLCRDTGTRADVAALSAAGRVAVADEAALLGYPRCCVAQHHAQALGLERLLAETIERQAQGDPVRAARLTEAGVAPLPSSREGWARHASLSAIAPSRFTSVNMCRACAADRDSPARRLSRRYEQLAARAHYPAR